MDEESGLTEKKPLTEKAKLGAYGAVALVVGLIGIAISSQFDPLQASSPGGPVATPEAVTTTTSTTVAAGDTTTPSGASTTSPTPQAGPATFSVSAEVVDFGDDATTGGFEITNSGSQAGQFTVTASSEVIMLASEGGELGPGESMEFQVGLDREVIEEGELEATVIVAWDGGEQTVAVIGSQFDNPIIHNPQASPSEVQVDGECVGGRTTVSARIRDTSEFISIVRWSPDGGGTRETEMVHAGNEIYEAEIGPFTAVGSREARIVATDTLGNAGGANVDITVTDCA